MLDALDECLRLDRGNDRHHHVFLRRWVVAQGPVVNLAMAVGPAIDRARFVILHKSVIGVVVNDHLYWGYSPLKE